jgi:hypothetical protein
MPVIHLVFFSSACNWKLIAFVQKNIYGSWYFFYNERWHCYDAHSDLSNGDPIELLNDLNTIIKSTRKNCHTHIIITGRHGFTNNESMQ